MKIKSSDKALVRLIVDACQSFGISDIVVSPGSRNAPLVIAFDENPYFNCTLIHDERSAGFFALGISDQTRKPVAVVCTSGSASANYYPAVVEAYYRAVPLIVITADRPEEWVDQGDGQTIVQKNMFGSHARSSCDLQEKEGADLSHEYEEIRSALSLGLGDWKGPVHINVGLKEPLYGTTEIEDGLSEKFTQEKTKYLFSEQEKNVLEEGLKLERKLILCGQMTPAPILNKLITQFAEDTSVAVLVENTSNLTDKKFIHCIDRTLNTIREDQIEEFKPQLLITVGGAVVSKRIKTFLRNSTIQMHWRVGFEFPEMNTYRCLTDSFECGPIDFFEQLNNTNHRRSISNYGSRWRQKDLEVQDKLSAFFEVLPFSDLKVFELMHDYLPEGCSLHMANSSVVRYCQLFDPIPSIEYYSNRGVSGIDGSSSTAVGAAYATPERLNVLITGDVSFFYDSNAFWNKYLGSNLRVILVNNGGGGIFNIIPGPSSVKQNKDYFVAEHQHNAEGIASTFGLEYRRISDQEELETSMPWFYQITDKPKILEVFTSSEINHEMLNKFFNELK